MGFIKKIIAISGTRADYGIYTSVFEKLNKEFEFSILVTGMHLDRKRGYTIDEIKKDGYRICGQIKILGKKTDHKSMAEAVGKAVIGVTKILNIEKPDLLMVLGDRGEMLAGAISAIHLNIPVAHLHGGESSGSVDNNLRHSITKLSHIHFVSTEDSKRRVIQLGENPKNVFNTGAPSLDSILKKKLFNEKKIRRAYNIKDENYFILIFHPTTTDGESTVYQIRTILSALNHFKIKTMAIKSNTDAGGDLINKELICFTNKEGFIKLYNNIPYIEYLSLLKHSSLLIGNSSSGIIETPSFKIPVINIGDRQRGRIRAGNIIDVKFDTSEISSAINKIMTNKIFRKNLNKVKNPYGNGKSSDYITKVFKNLRSKSQLIHKNFYNIIFN